MIQISKKMSFHKETRMDSIYLLKQFIENKKEDFIYEYDYAPSYITININFYRKLEDILAQVGMTMREFEVSIVMNIKTSTSKHIALH